ncbi:MAG: SpoIIE family protein phosphatase [Acidobacteria bacterium]|nr:SpoIIE family protein phosphatase [Acidobacteriota bacterium]
MLLREVDDALLRLSQGSYGLCEECHDPIEKERLLADPLIRFCLDHLTVQERRAFEQDMETARNVQNALLPKAGLYAAWEIHYLYQPLGVVSGDYCDVVVRDSDPTRLLVLLGDVAGKGVGASLLMSHMHAMFRSLSTQRGGIDQIVEQANRLLCESTQQSHYATLACVETTPTGEVEVCNAGHCSPLVFCRHGASEIASTGLPLGLFSTGKFPPTKIQMEPGDVLLLYSDGLIESENATGEYFGAGRLMAGLQGARDLFNSEAIVDLCMRNLSKFLDGSKLNDDLTVLAIRRTERSAA